MSKPAQVNRSESPILERTYWRACLHRVCGWSDTRGELAKMVATVKDKTQRDDGKVGKGYKRKAFDVLSYKETESTYAEDKDGLRREYMDFSEFTEWWMRKMSCLKTEAEQEWHRRLHDPATKVLPDPETKQDTIAIWKRFGEISTGKRMANSMSLSVKDIRQPKEDKINVVRGNLTTRLNSGSVASDSTKASLFKGDSMLNRFDSGSDLILEPAKKESPLKRKELTGSEAALQADSAALQVELHVMKQRTSAQQTLIALEQQPLAALEKTVRNGG